MADPRLGLRRRSQTPLSDTTDDLLAREGTTAFSDPLSVALSAQSPLDNAQIDPSTGAPRPELQKSLILGNLQNEAANINSQAAVAAAQGNDNKATQLAQRGLRLNQEAQRFRPKVFETGDIDGIGSALQFGANQAASQVSNLTQIAGTAIPAAVAFSNPFTRGLRSLPAFGKAASTLTRPITNRVTSSQAALGGTAFESARLNTGEIAGNVLLDPDSNASLQERGIAAIGGGTLAGSLDIIPAAQVFKRLGLKKTLDGFIGRTLKATLGQGVTEASTEAVQTVIGRATHRLLNENIEVLGEEGFNEIFEAMAAGFAGGATIGAGSSAAGGLVQLGSEFTAPKGPVTERFEALEADDEIAASGIKFSRDGSGIKPVEDVVPTFVRQRLGKDSPVSNDPVMLDQVSRALVAEAQNPGTLGDIGLNTLETVFGSAEELDIMLSAVAGQLDIQGDRPRTGLDQVDELNEAEGADGTVSNEELNAGGFSEIEEAGFEAIPEQKVVQRTSLSRQIAELKGNDPSKISDQDKAFNDRLERLRTADPSREFEIVNGVEAVRLETGESGPQAVVNFGRKKIADLIKRHEALPDAEKQRLTDLTDDEVVDFVRENFQSIVSRPIPSEFQSGDVEVLTPQTLRSFSSDLGEGGAINAQRIKVGLPRKDGKKGFVEQQVDLSGLIKRLTPQLKLDDRNTTESNEAALTSVLGELIRLNDEGVVQFDVNSISPNTKVFGRKISDLITLRPQADTIGSKGKPKATKEETAARVKKTKAAVRQSPAAKKISGLKKAIEAKRDELEGLKKIPGKNPKVPIGEDQELVPKLEAIRKTEAKIAELEQALVKTRNPQDFEPADADFDNTGTPAPAKLEPIRENPTIDSVKEERHEVRQSKGDKPVEDDVLDAITDKHGGLKLSGLPEAKKVAQKAVDAKKPRAKEMFEQLIELTFKLRSQPTTGEQTKNAEEVRAKMQGVVDSWRNAIGMKLPLRITDARGIAEITVGNWRVDAARAKGVAVDQVTKLEFLVGVDKAGNDIIQLKSLEEVIAEEHVHLLTHAGATIKNRSGTNEQAIWVDETRNDAKIVSILAHEFGHAVIDNTNISKATAQALIKDYSAFLERRGLSTTEIETEMERISRATLVGEIRSAKADIDVLSTESDKHIADILSDKGVVSILYGNPITSLSQDRIDYVTSFDEWFAEQVSKWFETAEKPQTLAEKYFAGIADAFKKLVKLIQARPALEKPAAESVSDFMDMLFDKSHKVSLFGQVRQKQILKFIVSGDVKLSDGATKALGDLKVSPQRAFSIRDSVKLSADSSQLGVKTAYDHLKPNERRVLHRAFTQPRVIKQLLSKLEAPLGMRGVLEGDPRQAIALGYRLWRKGDLNIGPQTETAFHKLRQLISNVVGIVSEEEQALQVLEAMKSGTLNTASGRTLFEIKAQRTDNVVQKTFANVNVAVDAMAKVLHPFYIAQSRLEISKNPVLQALGNQIQVRVGQEGKSESYVAARTRRVSGFSNKFNRVFEDLNADQSKELMAVLRNPKLRTRDPQVRSARTKTRALMNELLEYGREKGLKIDERKNYFPWVYDVDKLLGNRDKFIKFLAQDKFAADLLALTGAEDATIAANHVFDAIMGNNGLLDAEMSVKEGVRPAMSALNKRVLGFIEEKGNAEDLRQLNEFFAENPHEVMARYIDQLVKRAEFTARFGENGQEIQKQLLKAKELGATDKELQLANDYIDAAMGFYGVKELHPALKAVLKSWDHIFGTELSSKDPRTIRKFQGAMMVYQNIRVLALATLTSLADAGGIIVRSDSPEAAYQGMRQGVKEVAAGILARKNGDMKAYRTEMTKLAEDIGIIDHYMINEMLGQMYGGYFMSGGARRINDKFFQVIGLQQWTRMSRVMALAAGRTHIAKADSRRLAQLNLTKDDVVLEDGQLRVLTDGQRESASAADIAKDDKIRAALNEFVDQAVVRPNSAQRPIVASHPDMALVFHLQQFTFSIHDRIVRGVLHETAEGNYWPIAAMVSYPAIMALSNVMRELIQHGPDGDERKEDWTFADHLEMNVRRSGMTGLGTLLMDINQDIAWNGLPFDSLVGPTFDQGTDVIDALFSDDPYKKSRVAVDAIPGNNVFKYWDLERDPEDYIIEMRDPRT